jgi:hypothetical protein
MKIIEIPLKTKELLIIHLLKSASRLLGKFVDKMLPSHT